MNDFTPRLKWRKTWPDKPDDFAAMDGEHKVGRIYRDREPVTMNERWKWSMYDRHPHPDRGYEPTAREAARRVEDVWFRTRK